MDKSRPHQILLGFDFGTKRIGVAMGQTLTHTAQALLTLPATAGKPNWDQLARLIEEWRPDGLVVGIPLNMDGTSQPLTELAQTFLNELATRFKLPVYSMDERLSTIAARDKVFAAGGYKALQKQAIDSIAAQLILESWLAEYKGP